MLRSRTRVDGERTGATDSRGEQSKHGVVVTP